MYIKDNFIGTHRYYDFSTLKLKSKILNDDSAELWDSGINLLHKNAEIESVASITTLKKESFNRFNRQRKSHNRAQN